MGRKKRKIVELDIESLGFEGVAVAKKEGQVYFVKNAVPGDKVKAFVKRKRKNYSEAIVNEVLQPSKDRIDPVCKYFEDCGGCNWQNITYEDQLSWKKTHVKDAFERIGKIETDIYDVLESPKQFHYRNKMDLTISANRWLTQWEVDSDVDFDNRYFAIGMHTPGRFDKVIDIKTCHIQPEEGDEIVSIIRNTSNELGLTAYNKFKKEGFMKGLILRKSVSADEIMLILVTNTSDEEKDAAVKKILDNLNEKFNNINFIHAINSTSSPVKIESYNTLQGNEYIIEEILGIKYKISPFSFFQTNSYQLDQFIWKIVEAGELSESDIVWDLYCGTGSITLPASRNCKEIYGVEMVQSSIDDAKENTELNDINNAEFFAADLHDDDMPELLNSLPKPDVIFIDPPRAGMHKNLVEHLRTIGCEKIIYVSCNPATQARDCELLKDMYNIKSVQPVDMFPQTYHIESIAILEKL